MIRRVQRQDDQQASDSREVSHDSQIAIWNPTAIGRWSFLFTWGWGALLVAKNWRTLGDPKRADRNMIWFYGIFAYVFMCYYLPNNESVNQLSRKGRSPYG